KGVSAALLMANIQATLRARLPHETDLALLADRLDRELDQTTPGGVYLTLFLAILETDGGVLRYVNAGHNPQFVLRGSSGTAPMGSTGMPIALYPGHGYNKSRANTPPAICFFSTPTAWSKQKTSAAKCSVPSACRHCSNRSARRVSTRFSITSRSASPPSAVMRNRSTTRR